jgi:L,D-transpeptidase ErfK/SrfK
MFVLPGTEQDGLYVNLPERMVYEFKAGELAHTYPCAVGMGGRFATPTGDFKIVNKQKDPIWTPPDWSKIKDPVQPGPDNPLGDRWIGLSAPGVGLHATNDPMSIGMVVSHGCMRMYPWCVRELFEDVEVGWPVHIVYEPIKVGLDPDDHTVYLSVFPDIYHQVPDMVALARQKLDKLGVLPLVDEARLKALVSQQAGMPMAVVGSDVVVKVNGKRVDSTLSPLWRDGQVWVGTEVFRAAGLSVRQDDVEKTLMVEHDNDEVHFELAGDSTVHPVRCQGVSYLPLSTVLASLNVTYKWDAPHRTYLIYVKPTETRS